MMTLMLHPILRGGMTKRCARSEGVHVEQVEGEEGVQGAVAVGALTVLRAAHLVVIPLGVFVVATWTLMWTPTRLRLWEL